MRKAFESATARRQGFGFTLIELTVVIAIIAILAGALLPVITQPYLNARRAELDTEMTAIHDAIVGHPEVGDYGYLGTLGALPVTSDGNNYVSFDLLAPNGEGPTLPNAQIPTDPLTGRPEVDVVEGWNGPYLLATTRDPLEDPWGTRYRIYFNPNDPTQWLVQSAGADRAFAVPGSSTDTDDIYLPTPIPPSVNGNSSTVPVYWSWEAKALTVFIDDVPQGTPVFLHYLDGKGNDKVWQNASFATDVNGAVVFLTPTPGLYLPYGHDYVAFQVNNVWYYRSFVVDSPVTIATIDGPKLEWNLTCTLPNGSTGTSGFVCNPSNAVTIPPNAWVEAHFTGVLKGGSTGSPCTAYVLVTTNTQTTDPGTPYVNIPVTEETQASGDSVSATRAVQLTLAATQVNPALVVGGAGCSVDYGALSLQVRYP